MKKSIAFVDAVEWEGFVFVEVFWGDEEEVALLRVCGVVGMRRSCSIWRARSGAEVREAIAVGMFRFFNYGFVGLVFFVLLALLVADWGMLLTLFRHAPTSL